MKTLELEERDSDRWCTRCNRDYKYWNGLCIDCVRDFASLQERIEISVSEINKQIINDGGLK